MTRRLFFAAAAAGLVLLASALGFLHAAAGLNRLLDEEVLG